MKKTLSLVIGLFSVFASLAQTEIINIPDPNFKNALLTHDPVIDTNGDGEIQLTEAQVVTSLDIPEKNITNLSGIEYFVNLNYLECSENQLTNLDITQNIALQSLYCNNNQLTNLDVSQNTALETLVCFQNQLTNLDVSQNTNLEGLMCDSNQLTSLDLTQNTDLGYLICSKNQLTSLDLTQNIVLEGLYCKSNHSLTSLNLANSNNGNIILMVTDDCPNLNCIQIDEGFTPPPFQAEANNNFGIGWKKDDTASYSTDCTNASIEEVYTLEATIFPNPTTDVLYLETERPITATTVYDLSGREVFSTKETHSVDVSQLPNGVYFIEIKTNKEIC